MSSYVDYPVVVDPERITRDSLAQLRAATGARLNEGHPLVALLEVVAFRHAETRIILTDFAAAAFRDFGRKIVGVEQIPPAPATTASLWTAVDNAGYTIPQGTRVVYTTAGDRRIAFAVVGETVIPPGETTAVIELAAVITGEDANGLPAGPVTVVDQLGWVASVVTTIETAGGFAGEPDSVYLDRLTGELRLLSRIPIRPGDYAVAARAIAGVHRALVINLYDAATSTAGVEGHVTVVPVTASGAALDTQSKLEVEALLTDDGMRLINVVVHVEDPTPVAFAVTFTATAEPDADASEVQAAAIAVLNGALAAGAHAGGAEDPPVWRNEPVIRWLDLVGLLYAVDGLRTVVSLTIGGAAADLDMSAGGTVLAPLPDATVTGTVT